MKSFTNAAVLRTALTLTALCAAPALRAAPSASAPSASSSIFTLNKSIADPTRDFRYQPEGLSSSSDATPSLDAERGSLGESFDGGQPPPGRRRTYGRSRYQDRLHNADGSTKIAFVAGAGLNVPIGNTGRYYTPSYAVLVGAGLNFNKTFGVLGEFHYDHMGLTSGSINYDYAKTLAAIAPLGGTAADLAGFDANAHILAITVNPVVNLVGQGKVGAYVTGGLGYYRKTTNFTLPQLSQTYYGQIIQQNVTFDSYSSGGVGYNGGVGLTYKLSEFSSERLFMEARYEWINLGKNSNEFFPFNKRNSGTVPITVGIRF
jgi:opacity protein-like surface antigen